MRRALAAFVVACVAALAPLSAYAQSAPPVTAPFSFTAQNQQVTVPLNGQTWCSVAVAATSGTLVPSASTDNATFTTVLSIGNGAIVTNGTYSGNATAIGLNYFRLQQTTAGASSGTVTCTASAGAQPSGFGSNGPALFPACDQSVAVNIGSATTTQLVTLVANKTIWPCNFDATISGTTPTIQFEYGTGASPCTVGTTTLSGTYAFTAGAFVSIGNTFGILARLPVGASFCIVTGGTGPSVQGILTYAIF